MLFVGVDTGGTFTDLVAMDEAGVLATAKVPTTPGELERGVVEGLVLLAAERGVTLEGFLGEVVSFGYGTTQATNALIERNGARTGLITTAGFGDTILIQRLMGFAAGIPTERLGRFSLRRYPSPVVPKPLIREVPERIDQAGEILHPLDEDAVRRAAGELLDLGVEALAVSLLWSFRNPVHERRIGEIVRELAGERAFVTLSSEVSPVIGEYERTATTVLNAYLGQAAGRHLGQLDGALRSNGFRGVLRVLNSIGGVMSAEDAALRSVLLLTSGPTGGVTGSRYLAQAMGHENVITSDMGGTSFDVSLIIGGRPAISAVTEVGRYHIATPMIDITTVGAGGGSVVTVRDGLIRVGPESAGAHPGPVCYGRAGERVTVTDADLVLGVIDPEHFLGGRMRLDEEAAERAIREQVAEPLGLSVEEAAAGIRRIVDSNMANTLREVTIGRGHDPREFVLYAYGGAGPTHSAGYGRELGVRQILIPATSPVHSAYGALASDVLYSAERSLPMTSRASGEDFDASAIEAQFETLEDRCRRMLAAHGLGDEESRLGRFVDMRYRMQTHELIIPVPDERVDEAALAALAARFERTYEETYGEDSGYSVAGIEIETFRVEAVGRTRKPSLAAIPERTPAPPRERLIYDLESGARVSHAVVEWAELPAGHRVAGPAVIEHATTTIYVASGQSAEVDRFGNLVIEMSGGLEGVREMGEEVAVA